MRLRTGSIFKGGIIKSSEPFIKPLDQVNAINESIKSKLEKRQEINLVQKDTMTAKSKGKKVFFGRK
jgi:hypothetical protein